MLKKVGRTDVLEHCHILCAIFLSFGSTLDLKVRILLKSYVDFPCLRVITSDCKNELKVKISKVKGKS